MLSKNIKKMTIEFLFWKVEFSIEGKTHLIKTRS